MLPWMVGDKNVNKNCTHGTFSSRDSFQSKLHFCIFWEVKSDTVMSTSLQPHSALANANIPEAKE